MDWLEGADAMDAAVRQLTREAEDLGAHSPAIQLLRLEELEGRLAALSRELAVHSARGNLALHIFSRALQNVQTAQAGRTADSLECLRLKRHALAVQLDETLPALLRPIAWRAALALGRVDEALGHIKALLRGAPLDVRAIEALDGIQAGHQDWAAAARDLRRGCALERRAVLPLEGAQYPADIVCSAGGVLFVTDTAAGSLRLYAQDGALLRHLEEGLSYPYGVAALDDPQDVASVMCCDQGNMRLVMLDDAGEVRGQVNVRDLLGFGEVAVYPTMACGSGSRIVVTALTGDGQHLLFSFDRREPEATLYRFSPDRAGHVTGLHMAGARLYVVRGEACCVDIYGLDRPEPTYERSVPVSRSPVKLVRAPGGLLLVTEDRLVRYTQEMEVLFDTPLPIVGERNADSPYARMATGPGAEGCALYILSDVPKNIQIFTL